jgi:hypothetical protein
MLHTLEGVCEMVRESEMTGGVEVWGYQSEAWEVTVKMHGKFCKK